MNKEKIEIIDKNKEIILTLAHESTSQSNLLEKMGCIDVKSIKK